MTAHLKRVGLGLVVATLTVGVLLSDPAVSQAMDSSQTHPPIVIQSDSDFGTCTCVLGGSGTTSDPYVIGPWSINSVRGDAVFVDGTNLTKSFVLFNLTIAGNGVSSARGIVLQNINPSGNRATIRAAVFGAQTSIQSLGVGILVQTSREVTLDGVGANPAGPGISKYAGTINKNANGAIDVEQSSHITVTGWQLSANGADVEPDWVTLDPSVRYWGVRGVRFFGVTNSLIDHNAANNCTSVSYALFNSSHNTVSNNTADYPFILNFLVTAGSSYNMLINNEGGTADFIGLMVADPLPRTWTLKAFGPSHDNLIQGNIIHTNGPTGEEVHAGIAPAFLGGIMVLNGTYNNQITNNQAWGSTGFDLTWAQVVPDSHSVIGVVTWPPTASCNVAASEGGGGVANHNGNVWTGNTVRNIAPCIPPQ